MSSPSFPGYLSCALRRLCDAGFDARIHSSSHATAPSLCLAVKVATGDERIVWNKDVVDVRAQHSTVPVISPTGFFYSRDAVGHVLLISDAIQDERQAVEFVACFTDAFGADGRIAGPLARRRQQLPMKACAAAATVPLVPSSPH